jgi:tetratricopeptide (TPR) repeat protein
MSVKCAFFVATVLFVAACSRNADKYLASGDKSFLAGKYSEAVTYYRMQSRSVQSWQKRTTQLARAYLELKSFQPAYDEVRETIALEPGNAEAQLQFAALLSAGKKYGEAMAAALSMLKREPNNARAHAILGDQFALAGDPEKAIPEYRTAIKLDSRQVESYSALAAIYQVRRELSNVSTGPRRLPSLLRSSCPLIRKIQTPFS